MAILTRDEGNLVGFRITSNGRGRSELDVVVYSENADTGYIAFSAKDEKGMTALEQVEMFIVYDVLPNLIIHQES